MSAEKDRTNRRLSTTQSNEFAVNAAWGFGTGLLLRVFGGLAG
jgi:hypothetical protein